MCSSAAVVQLINDVNNELLDHYKNRRRFREDLFTITYGKLVSATQTKRTANSFPLKVVR